MKTVSIAEARNSLTELVYEAEDGRPVQFTRRGRAVAVLVGEAEYDRLKAAAGSMDFAEWAQTWRSGLPASFEGITPDELARWREV